MKRISLLLLVFFLCANAYTQDTILVHKVNSTNREYRLITVPDETNNRLYFFIMSQFAFDCYETNLATRAVTSELTAPRADEKEFGVYLGHIYKDRNVQLAFRSPATESFNIVDVDFATKKFTINNVKVPSSDELKFGTFVHNDSLYALHLQRKSSAFVIYRVGIDSVRKSTLDFSQTPYANLEQKPITAFLSDNATGLGKAMLYNNLALIWRKPQADIWYVTLIPRLHFIISENQKARGSALTRLKNKSTRPIVFEANLKKRKEKDFKTIDDFVKKVYPNLVAISVTGSTQTHLNLRMGAFKEYNEYYLDAVLDRNNVKQPQENPEPSIQEKLELFDELMNKVREHVMPGQPKGPMRGAIEIIRDKAIYCYYDEAKQQIGFISFSLPALMNPINTHE